MKYIYVLVILFIIALLSIAICNLEKISCFLYPDNQDRNGEVVKLTLSVIGGIGVLLGLYIAHKRAMITERTVENQGKQLEHAQKSQIDERFKNAVEHLGSDKEAVILGGVVELHQIAQENSKTYGEVVFNILTSYIRSQTDCTIVESKDIKKAVIQTICDYLFKNKEKDNYPFTGYIANLESVNLSSINLDDADMSNINLYDSFLPSCKNTNYEKANLRSCVFFDGTIEYNNFINACLSNTRFLFTKIIESDFGGDENRGAKFLYSRILGGFIYNGFTTVSFYKSVIHNIIIESKEFSFNLFIFCNLIKIDFSKLIKMEFCNFSKSGFLECKMPNTIHNTQYSSCYDLGKSVYSFFDNSDSDPLIFSNAKTNITNLAGITFDNNSQEFKVKRTDLTSEEIDKYHEMFTKLIKIHNWKKYSKDVNEIIDIKLSNTNQY